ncbi:MAG: hypothetical protein ACRD82_00605, partial [Blastocatellia bacterium]
MKKFSFLLALSLLASAIAVSPAKAQDEKQAEFERVWYGVCYTEKPYNEEKCIQLSKELLEKYQGSQYAKNAKGKVDEYTKRKGFEAANEKFQVALKAY